MPGGIGGAGGTGGNGGHGGDGGYGGTGSNGGHGITSGAADARRNWRATLYAREWPPQHRAHALMLGARRPLLGHI